MKIIIGVYDRELSHNLAILLSSKNFSPIEAESFEEIPALLERHSGAFLITEEINLSFYQQIKQRVPKTEIFFLFHQTMSTRELLKFQHFGIKAVIPYSENAMKIVDVISDNLSLKKTSIKAEDISLIMTSQAEHKNAAMHMSKSKKWIYGDLQGFNNSKVAIHINDKNLQELLLENAEEILMYLQGMNIRMYVDLVFNKKNIFVFRYRKMSQSDAERLAYYIHYCQKYGVPDKVAVHY